MALEGVCEIELRDEQGNVVQKTRDKNMITNAISILLNVPNDRVLGLLGMVFSNLYYNNVTPILDKLIGGVFLFNEVQNEDINNIIPNFATLTGCASLSKKDVNSEYNGTINVNESQIVYGNDGNVIGLKFVFDFPTDRANGTIKSISLTSDLGARLLFSQGGCMHDLTYSSQKVQQNYIILRALNNYSPVLEIINKNLSDPDINSYYSYSLVDNKIITATNNNEIIFVNYMESSTKKIRFRKYKIKNKLGLRDNYTIFHKQLNDTYKDYFDIISESELIDLSDIFYGSDSYFNYLIYTNTFFYNGYIYYANAFNSLISYVKIDPKTFNIVETFKRTFEQGGLNASTYRNNYASLKIYKNYFVVSQYLTGNDYSEILFINISDLTVAKSYKITSASTFSKIYCGYIGDCLIINVLDEYNSSKNYFNLFVDGNLNIKKINTNSNNKYTPIQQNMFDFPFALFDKFTIDGIVNVSGTSFGLLYYPKFTIDNLATQVTKTASQTMKVIYTIKDVEEQQ